MPDSSFRDATMEAIASSIAQFFRILVEGGMTRDEALLVTLTWVKAVLERGSDE